MILALRAMLFLCSLLVLVSSVGIMGAAVGWDPSFTLNMLAQWLVANPLQTGLIGIFAFAIAVFGISLSLRSSQEVPAIIKKTNLGVIQISLQALESLVRRAASEIEGVRTIEPTIRHREGKFEVHLALEVVPDTNIPSLADRVQTRIEDYLAQTVGITDVQVSLTVKEIATGLQKARVK